MIKDLTIGKYTFAAKTIIAVIGIAIIIAICIAVPSCLAKYRAEHSQGKIDRAQSGAFANSSGDAINTQSDVNARESESEATTRTNERDIRDAQGSTDVVNPGVRDAGFASLCKRPSFRASDTGRLRCPAAAGVAQGR